MTDRELAARWDADHRLAALVSFVAGVVVAVGTALVFSVGIVPIVAINEGRTAGAFQVNLVAGLLLVVDVALLVFVIGLAYAVTGGWSFGLVLTSAVVAVATAVSATLHLVWAYAASSPEAHLAAEFVQFWTWLASNLWLTPLFGLLVGVTLLALSLPLRTSQFRFAQRLGTASVVVGALLCVLAPFAGFDANQPALVAVAAVLVATAGISALLVVALARLGLLLGRTRRSAPVHAN